MYLSNVKIELNPLKLTTLIMCNSVPVGYLELNHEGTAFGNEAIFRFTITPIIVTNNGKLFRIESKIIDTCYSIDSTDDLNEVLDMIEKCLEIEYKEDESSYIVKYCESIKVAPFYNDYKITYSLGRKYAFYKDSEGRSLSFVDKNSNGFELCDKLLLKRDCLDITLPLPEVQEEERRAYVSIGK